MKLVQVNVTANRGSTGRIAEEIGRAAIGAGWESWIAYGREPHGDSASQLIRIGSDTEMRLHGLATRLLDRHGLASRAATRRLLRRLDDIRPDLVHLHNIHGYFINYPMLFRWLRQWGGPVVWTLHDCWPMTGHCAHFMGAGCDRWLTECHDCPLRRAYPGSLLADRSRLNFRRKREAFTSLGRRLTIVSCSRAVADYTARSFLGASNIRVIHNGLDLNIFRPTGAPKERLLLGVASVWPESKGLGEFVRLRGLLPADWRILLVGLSAAQIASLPTGIEGMTRTDSITQLIDLYSRATALVNPTFEDNFPTVNIEALACGTPVVTYRTGGSPEAIDAATGIVVDRGDVRALADACLRAADLSGANCRARACAHFDARARYADYLNLYNQLLNG